MLFVGFGMYQIIYSYIQLSSVFIWAPVGTKNGLIALQGTNLGVFWKNDFSNSFAAQFIVLLFFIASFFTLVVTYERIPHNKVATMIRRKRVIFPTRISILTINLLFFSSLASISSLKNYKGVNVLNLVFSILGMGWSILTYVSIFFLCNFKRFKIDDPNYYVITEKMVSRRWWVKNNLFVWLTNSFVMIMVFVLGFGNPTDNWIVMVVFQSLYTLYILLILPYTKIRYKLFNLIGSGLFIAYLVVLVKLPLEFSNSLFSLQKAFASLLCIVYMLACVVELLISHKAIYRYLVEFYNEYIICDDKFKSHDLNDRLYRSETRRERVIEFQDNAVYGMDLKPVR